MSNNQSEIEILLKKYYNDANDPIKNWKEGERWSNENDKLKIRKNALYTQFSILDAVVNEIKSTRNRFQWSPLEKKYAKQMIKCLNFNGRNPKKVLVSVIVLTKLIIDKTRKVHEYDNILVHYNVSYDFLLKTSMQLHKDFTRINIESHELYDGQYIAYAKGDLLLDKNDKKLESIDYYSNNYCSDDYSDSENFDYSL